MHDQKSRAEFQRRSFMERVIRLESFRCELNRTTIPSTTAVPSTPGGDQQKFIAAGAGIFWSAAADTHRRKHWLARTS